MINYKKVLPQFFVIAIFSAFTAVVSNGFFFAAILSAFAAWGILAMFLSDDHRTWPEGNEKAPENWLPGNPDDRWINGYPACVGATIANIAAGYLLNRYQHMLVEENATAPGDMGYLIMIPFLVFMMTLVGAIIGNFGTRFVCWAARRKYFKQYLTDL